MKRLAPLLLVLLAGCSEPAAPPKPAAKLTPAAPVGTMSPAARSAQQEQLARIVEYTKAHPWGENTGTATVRGRLLWTDGSGPEQPVVRRGVLLKGLKGTPTEGVYYSVRTDEHGEFKLERIRGGAYKLTDEIAAGFHWRLRVDVRDDTETIIDLTPTNSVAVRDDFPDTGR
jgi:hypothetical protein